MFDMPPVAYLANPNIVLLLLILGAAAFSWELHAPGLYLPGVAGAIVIVSVFTAFTWLPLPGTASRYSPLPSASLYFS
jgi:membrane-bound ClpP family serine protease